MRMFNLGMYKFIFLLLGSMSISPVFAAEKIVAYIDPACVKHAENEVVGSKTFAGKLTEFVWGDFLHGEFVDDTGKPQSLFIETSDISCFLALNKDERVLVTYNTLCRYVENGAGIYPVEEIIQIKTKKDDLVTWRQQFDTSGNSDTCNKLEEKYTRKQ